MTITTKMFLGLTMVCLAVVSTQALVTRWNFNRGLLAYIDEKESVTAARLVAELASNYERDQSLDVFRDEPRRWRDLLRRTTDRPRTGPPAGGRPLGRGRPMPPGSDGPRGMEDALSFSRRIALIDAEDALIVGMRPTLDARSFPIVVNDVSVGYVFLSPMLELDDPASQRFAEQQGRSLVLSALAALLLAAIASALLARQFTKPVKSLVNATRAMTAGDYQTRVIARGHDELGDLTADFNKLAETLERNRESQRRWVTDIAHELRTPLAVLKGELEAVEDGVRVFDANTHQSLQAELNRLISLVGELHTLSLVEEAGLADEVSTIDLADLLTQALERASGRLAEADITLNASVPDQGWLVEGNADQLIQVFLNIIENAARYVDAPGRLDVTGEKTSSNVSIVFADTGPGVPSYALDRLFDRLYRVDASRSRESGGSGLGLAICKAIVERHGAEVTADHSALGGLEIRLTFAFRRPNKNV